MSCLALTLAAGLMLAAGRKGRSDRGGYHRLQGEVRPAVCFRLEFCGNSIQISLAANVSLRYYYRYQKGLM